MFARHISIHLNPNNRSSLFLAFLSGVYNGGAIHRMRSCGAGIRAGNWRAQASMPAAFFAIAVLFNPIAPVALSRSIFLWLDAVCLAMFLASLALLKTRPQLSIASITDPDPRK